MSVPDRGSRSNIEEAGGRLNGRRKSVTARLHQSPVAGGIDSKNSFLKPMLKPLDNKVGRRNFNKEPSSNIINTPLRFKEMLGNSLGSRSTPRGPDQRLCFFLPEPHEGYRCFPGRSHRLYYVAIIFRQRRVGLYPLDDTRMILFLIFNFSFFFFGAQDQLPTRKTRGKTKKTGWAKHQG